MVDAAMKELRSLMPPPISPVEPARAEDLDETERRLGVRLPADYRAFVELFGSGSIGGFLRIANPSSRNPYIRLVEAHDAQVHVLHELRDSGVEELPYPVHPEPGGLILWAETRNGDCCYWVADPPDNPDAWPIAVNEGRAPYWFDHPGPMTLFLADLVARRIELPIFPDAVFKGRSFVPIDVAEVGLPNG
jgi:hypothetical protein